jgi:HAD superfamily phosphatase (TIGR01668 family)
MFLGLIKDQKFIPTIYKETVFDVDYIKLYESGIRLILTDLDNTLVSYKDNEVNDKLMKWLEERKREGFEIIIISNNSSEVRVREFAEKLGIEYVARAMKPLKCGFKRVLKKATRKFSPNEVVAIGDQLMTDVFAANRMNYTSILVKAIDRKTEKWTTRFNRILESHVLRRIKEKHSKLFEECLKEYEEENYGRN